MRTLLIASGNPLRGDDGAAPEVLRRLASKPGCKLLAVQQLTPELAEEMARFHRVVFLDADALATQVSMEPVPSATCGAFLTHITTPAQIVALSRALFGFVGAALLCRIPARDFGPVDSIGPRALEFVRQAAQQIESFL